MATIACIGTTPPDLTKILLPAVATGVAASASSVPSVAEQAAADLERSQVLDGNSRETINEDFNAAGQAALTADAHALGFNTEGDASVILEDAPEVPLASAESMEQELATAQSATTGAETGVQSQAGDNGVVTGIAATPQAVEVASLGSTRSCPFWRSAYPIGHWQPT